MGLKIQMSRNGRHSMGLETLNVKQWMSLNGFGNPDVQKRPSFDGFGNINVKLSDSKTLLIFFTKLSLSCIVLINTFPTPFWEKPGQESIRHLQVQPDVVRVDVA